MMKPSKRAPADTTGMEETIALEEEIRQALIDDRVPDSVLAWAHDILCNGWSETSCTRLKRLQTIVAEINSHRPGVTQSE